MQPLLAFLAIGFALGLCLGRWNLWLMGVLGMAAIVTTLVLWQAEGYM